MVKTWFLLLKETTWLLYLKSIDDFLKSNNDSEFLIAAYTVKVA